MRKPGYPDQLQRLPAQCQGHWPHLHGGSAQHRHAVRGQPDVLKSADGNGDSVQRYFFDYPQPVAGEGHFISTYKHNGSPIPSFEGEPLRFACPRTLGDFAHGLWSSLNADNKVSLFARVIDLESGESGDMIFNKYDAECSDLDDPEEPELLPEELELLKKLDAEEE